VVLIVLNADEDLVNVLRTAPAIVEGSELPPVFASGKDLDVLIDQADRWLAAGGGEWPAPDATLAKPPRRGRPKRTKESVLQAAEAAIGSGIGWSDFRRTEHPQRVLNQTELEELKSRFRSEIGT